MLCFSMLRFTCSPAVFGVVLLVILEFFSGVTAQDEGCYSSGSIAGIVIATIVVTVVMGALAAGFIWYILKQRRGGFGEDKPQEKSISCPAMSPDKQLIVHENSDYAFDNPYFKDDDTEHIKQDAAEKGESGFHLDNGDITPSQNSKTSNGTTGQPKKNRPFSSLPFHAVFHPSGKKQQRATTMDDTYISKHTERITVPLRGHDFTGLGFNICGNMRDGIFVRDVLHRGPASESGKIKAGDRIVGVTVSFGAMVYEDALTILSYASPYDVKLEIEKCPSVNNVSSVTNLPSSSPKRLGASTSFRNNGQRRLFHPLYRSQSIDDLTQIGKDNFLSSNSPAVHSKTQKEASASATPKRSQSVEASNGGLKTRMAYALKSNDEPGSKSLSSNKGSRKSSTSSCDSVGKIMPTSKPLPEKIEAVSSEKEEAPCIKKEVKSSRFRVEQISVKSEAPVLPTRQAPPAKPARETTPDEKQTHSDDDAIVPIEKLSEPQPAENKPTELATTISVQHEDTPDAPEVATDSEKPMAPPRKAATPAKRRAPAPPPVAPAANTTNKSETSAVVHRVDEQPAEGMIETAGASMVSTAEVSFSEPPPPPTSELPDFGPTEKTPEPDLGSSDASSVASGGLASQPGIKEEPSSPGKRKASSLGDLTTLERGSKNKASISSAILERAVSLDLQQSMPGETLGKQKRILKAPAFEDDCDESREGDFADPDGSSLIKRWDNGLDNVYDGLTNGPVKHDDDLPDKTVAPEKKDDRSTSPSQDATGEVPTKKLLTVDLDLDISSSSETSLPDAEESEKQLTSTPTRKVIEVKNFIKDDEISLDDVPYLASSAKKPSDEEISTKTSTPLFSPVTISIPIIKPDLTHFEKLPSPPPNSTHPALDPNWRVSKISSTPDEAGRYPLERISVQSLYRPIFSSKESSDVEDATGTAEKLVNGNDSDASDHYSTAQETSMETNNNSSTSTMSVTLSPTVANNVTVKTPNNAAGFAKTLIIPGPNEVESLLSLAAEPNTPPPQLEPPPKPVENE